MADPTCPGSTPGSTNSPPGSTAISADNDGTLIHPVQADYITPIKASSVDCVFVKEHEFEL